MENFEYSQPTNVLFGKNQILNLVDCLKPYGKRVLLVYGGESIKNNGLYQTIIELLKDFELLELGGIQPNPMKVFKSVRTIILMLFWVLVVVVQLIVLRL